MADYLKTDRIYIDAHLARFGSHTYSISNINSVRIEADKTIETAGYGAAAVCLVLGVALAFAGPETGSLTSRLSIAIPSLFIGAAFIAAAYRFGPIYRVFLSTSNGEQHAAYTRKRDVAQEVKAALEVAISSQRS